jgi:O-antigen/teichoic acid export membrane protein
MPSPPNARHTLHVALNISGVAAPVLVGVLTIPALIRQLGQDGFATLALGWALVGYFSLLDLGVGRALTMYIARSASSAADGSAALARAGRKVMLGLGALWTLLLLTAYPLVTAHWPLLREQTHVPGIAWALLVLCIPFTLWFSNSASLLEARSRFINVNAVRIPLGVATYAGPLLVSLYTSDIAGVFASLLVSRAVAGWVLAWNVRKEFVGGPDGSAPDHVRGLLKFGGWMTVSQVVGPVLVYVDRFAVAALVSAAAVTSYTVPFDVVTRLPAFPAAALMVLFPLFVRVGAGHPHAFHADGRHAGRPTLLLLLAVWLPGMALGAVVGPALLSAWVGGELAAASSPVWQWLVVGVTVNGLAQFPLLLLQSRERADVVAAIHLLELVPYLLLLWWALQQFGVAGAAIAWAARCTVDAVLLHLAARALVPHWRSLLDLFLGASLIAAGALAALAWSRA